HSRVRAPVFRGDGRGRALPHRRGSAGNVYRRGLERDGAGRSAEADGHDRRWRRRRGCGLLDQMNAFSSLTNRIFFATALLAVLSTSVGVSVVNRAVTRGADQEIQRGIDEAAKLVDQYRKFSFEAFGRDARFVADLPVLKAATAERDPATV